MAEHTESDLLPLLVTGANGFLGSEVVRQAVASGLKVRATDLGTRGPLPGIDFCQADIRDPQGFSNAMTGVSSVVHAAGLAHVFDRDKAATAPFRDVNEVGTLNVVQAAANAGVRHCVLASSVSVYGRQGTEMCDESATCRPDGPYAESKWAAERRAIEVAGGVGMQVTILRLATLYGEEDPGNIARLMRSIDRGRFVWVGDGSNCKSLLYRGDAARACLMALGSSADGVSIFNVSAPSCTMGQIVHGLASALGRRVPRFRIPALPALWLSATAAELSRGRWGSATLRATVEKWLGHDAYDASRFRQTFGFRTEVSLTEGLRREVVWYRNITLDGAGLE